MDGGEYEIVVRGRLGHAFTVWLEEMHVRASGSDDTHMIGYFPDQAALQKFLSQVGELGLELSTVRRLSTDSPA